MARTKNAAADAQTPAGQMTLFPVALPEHVLDTTVPLTVLPPDAELGPGEPEYTDSIRDYGMVLVPVLLIRNETGYTVADGARRIKSARAAGNITSIPARIFPAGWTIREVLALVANNQRKPNPVAELKYMERLNTEHNLPWDTMGKMLGLNRTQMKHRTRLFKLIPPLKEALYDGRLPFRRARDLCALTPAQQQPAADLLAAGKFVTEADVKQIRSVAAANATAMLPDDMFDTPAATDDTGGNGQPGWYAAVVDNVRQSIALIPTEPDPADVPDPVQRTMLAACRNQLEAWFERWSAGFGVPDADAAAVPARTNADRDAVEPIMLHNAPVGIATPNGDVIRAAVDMRVDGYGAHEVTKPVVSVEFDCPNCSHKYAVGTPVPDLCTICNWPLTASASNDVDAEIKRLVAEANSRELPVVAEYAGQPAELARAEPAVNDAGNRTYLKCAVCGKRGVTVHQPHRVGDKEVRRRSCRYCKSETTDVENVPAAAVETPAADPFTAIPLDTSVTHNPEPVAEWLEPGDIAPVTGPVGEPVDPDQIPANAQHIR